MQAVREQDEPHPTNQYGRSKLAGEQAIRAAGVPFTIFRPVVVYDRAARLAAIPAGESPANRGVQSLL